MATAVFAFQLAKETKTVALADALEKKKKVSNLNPEILPCSTGKIFVEVIN